MLLKRIEIDSDTYQLIDDIDHVIERFITDMRDKMKIDTVTLMDKKYYLKDLDLSESSKKICDWLEEKFNSGTELVKVEFHSESESTIDFVHVFLE